MFVLMSLSVLSIAYWKLMTYYAQQINFKERGTQSYQIAQAGLEDALYEIKFGIPWQEANLAGHGWQLSTGNTYFKTTNNNSLNPTLFNNIAATFSVTVSGNPSEGTVNITSESEIATTADAQSFKRTLYSEVIRSVTGEVFVLKTQEI